MSLASRFFTRQPARGRTTKRVPGTMNKTEARYELEVLKPLLASGRIIRYGFEDHTFKLGPDLRYTPDFSVQLPDGVMEMHEVKAGASKKDANGVKPPEKPLIEDDAKVKIVVAAEQLPYTFKVVWLDKTAGEWRERVY